MIKCYKNKDNIGNDFYALIPYVYTTQKQAAKYMCRSIGTFFLVVILHLFSYGISFGQLRNASVSQQDADNAKPWTFWYWMKASVSQQGIRADLSAMKKQGLGGAYMMFIQDEHDSLLYSPPATQLSPQWWKLVRYAVRFADSIHFKLALHVSDGFATAGGPWITPELSMQKTVWSEVNIKGGQLFNAKLPQPQTNENYYRDIAVYAFPTPAGESISTETIIPKVSTSVANEDAQFLIDSSNTKNFSSAQPCWIQYAFDQPFTCRTIKIRTKGITFQAKRLSVEISNDGKSFQSIGRLKPARSGWEDYLEDNTYSIPEATAKYFRFVYNPDGTEPGSEDLDAAKWKPQLKLCGLELLSAARINLYEGKNGEIWRIADRSTANEIPDSVCVPFKSVKDISSLVDKEGVLHWQIPAGNWTILRVGHTSTGMTNATAGGGKGLECDKFNPDAVKLQFDEWFKKIYDSVGKNISSNVIKIFHVDSWECGSQNWSPVFVSEFKKRRGYDPLPYLPVIAGIPVQSADVSERFLYDVRTTLAELLADNFFGTLNQLAHDNNCLIDAESVAPVMISDGMLHYKNVDIPMGEFWLRSPTHDKPNDMLDAISAGNIYGKKIIQSESFTELRNMWDEYPGMLKALQDRNFALGINRMVFHVFMENPWMDRKPGMTLGGVGLFFQRDQTWWQQAKAWVEYTERCQQLLQQGSNVKDIAVFTGEEIPRRAVLPDRLVNTLPGIFGNEKVEEEKKRLANNGHPMQQIPRGVSSSANITTPADWIDPLNGYGYDSFNQDALLRLMTVKDGNIILPGGAGYKILVFPNLDKMNPNNNLMSIEVANKILQLVKDGATILLNQYPVATTGLYHYKEKNKELENIVKQLFGNDFFAAGKHGFSIRHVGKGNLITGQYPFSNFDTVGVSRDIIIKNEDDENAHDIAWTHRNVAGNNKHIYFLSNQKDSVMTLKVGFKIKNKLPQLYDAVANKYYDCKNWYYKDGYTWLLLRFEPNASWFVIFDKATEKLNIQTGNNWLTYKNMETLKGPWNVVFDTNDKKDTFHFSQLTDWTKMPQKEVKYFSGTAVYSKDFSFQDLQDRHKTIWLSLGDVKDIAQVKLNGIDCGIAWTYPYKIDITKAIKKGNNHLEIEVTNTWANRLAGDSLLKPENRTTSTTAPFYLKENGLLSAGLSGPVSLEVSDKN